MEPNAQYRIQKSLRPVPILSQINTVHASPVHFLKIHFNIFLPSTPSSTKWFFPSGLPSKTLCAPLLPPISGICPRPQVIPLGTSGTHLYIAHLLRVVWAHRQVSVCCQSLAQLWCQRFKSSTSFCFNMEDSTVTILCLQHVFNDPRWKLFGMKT